MTTLPPTEPIVGRDGRPTVPFHNERIERENGILTCNEADLGKIKPGAGWTRFVLDLGIPVWGTGTQWVDATGGVIWPTP